MTHVMDARARARPLGREGRASEDFKKDRHETWVSMPGADAY